MSHYLKQYVPLCVKPNTNIDDLVELTGALKDALETDIDLLYGHSYGARLVYETCFSNPKLSSTAILSGRGLYPNDALENSVLIDLMILKETDLISFELAHKIVKTPNLSMPEKNEQIRKLFKDLQLRFKRRNDFIWGNSSARKNWEQQLLSDTIKDSDEAYFEICRTYEEKVFNPGFFDPQAISQKMVLFQGYFDFLMNGSCTPNMPGGRSVRFYGSGHFIHFEEPERFFEEVRQCLQP